MQLSFLLTHADRKIIRDDLSFSRVRVPLMGYTLSKGIKKRMAIAEGTVIATHANPKIGDLHASITGTVKNITDRVVEIEQTGSAEELALQKIEPKNLAGLAVEELLVTLKELGVSTRPFTRLCNTFVINGLNPEPGMAYAEELLLSYQNILEAGVNLIKRLSNAKEYILAVPDGNTTPLAGTTSTYVHPVYPMSLARPLCTEIFGKESTAGITVARAHAVFSLGLVAASGLPLTRTLVTVQGDNFLIPVGVPISEVLKYTGHNPEPGDTIILGGAMRGHAVSHAERGISKTDEAMFLRKKADALPLENNPCINCGACVHICPMRLRPNLLSRYVEFEQYTACRGADIELCIECGLCAFVCPACRPMQQQYSMAKQQLGLSSFQ